MACWLSLYLFYLACHGSIHKVNTATQSGRLQLCSALSHSAVDKTKLPLQAHSLLPPIASFMTWGLSLYNRQDTQKQHKKRRGYGLRGALRVSSSSTWRDKRKTIMLLIIKTFGSPRQCTDPTGLYYGHRF